MRKEVEYEYNDSTYLISQLPLGESQETLVRLMKLLEGVDGMTNLATIPARLSVKDINFLREKLFGQHCKLMNEQGAWVPMTPPIVENHFDGRIGAMFHVLAKCLIVNYSDFLADLRPDALLGEMVPDGE